MRATLALSCVALAATMGTTQDLPAEVIGSSVVDETLLGGLQDFDQLGDSVVVLGDLDGDGIDELAVGAPGTDAGGKNRGAVHVLFLDAQGTVATTATISAVSGGFGGALDDGDRFGCALAPLGDLDGDGVVDLAVGAVFDDDGGVPPNANVGAVWILFLSPDGGVASEAKISAGAAPLLGALDEDDRFGAALASLGDLDGDGVVDLAVGAPLDDDGGVNHGAVWVLSLRPDGGLDAAAKISTLAGGFTGTLAPLDEFGSGLAALGDLGGDGTLELAVGAPGVDTGGFDRGGLWILSLGADAGVQAQVAINTLQGGFDGALAAFDRFGSALAALGDHNADGVADLAVGAPFDDTGGTDSGAVWIVFLRPDGTARHERKLAQDLGGVGSALAAGDTFGGALAALGDLDGDGIDDLLVGAPGDVVDAGNDRGALHLLALTDHRATLGGGLPPRWTSDGAGAGTGEPVPGFGDDLVDPLDPDDLLGEGAGLALPLLVVEAATLLPGDVLALALRSPLPGALVALRVALVAPGDDVELVQGLIDDPGELVVLGRAGATGAFTTTLALGGLDDALDAAADTRLAIQAWLLDETGVTAGATPVLGLAMPGP